MHDLAFNTVTLNVFLHYTIHCICPCTSFDIMLIFLLCLCAIKQPPGSWISPNEPKMLHRELKEIILMKSVAALYKLLRVRLMPRADFISLITIVTVCFEWYIIITGRMFNLHQLRHVFRTMVIHSYDFHYRNLIRNPGIEPGPTWFVVQEIRRRAS